MINQRSIVASIVLSIVTCGIYSIFWYYGIVNDYCRVNGLEEKGGMVIVLTILTCGIYGIYWTYKMGELVETISGQNDRILYLVLTLFGFSIVNYAIWQDILNRTAERY